MRSFVAAVPRPPRRRRRPGPVRVRRSPSTDASTASAGGSASTSATRRAASASASPTKAALPAGSQWVEAPKSGIRFPVPEDWKAMSFREVLDSGDKEAIDEAAKSMGVTARAARRRIADQIEVIAFGPTVKELRGEHQRRAAAQHRDAVGRGGDQPARADRRQGRQGRRRAPPSLGKSLVVPYTLKVKDRTVQGRTLLHRDRRRGRHPHRLARVGRRGRQADQVDPRQRQRPLTSGSRQVDLHRPDRVEAGAQQRPQARDVGRRDAGRDRLRRPAPDPAPPGPGRCRGRCPAGPARPGG